MGKPLLENFCHPSLERKNKDNCLWQLTIFGDISVIPRDLYTDDSNGRRKLQNGSGSGHIKILQLIVSEFPESKHYWLSKEKCHWTSISERIWFIRSERESLSQIPIQKGLPTTQMRRVKWLNSQAIPGISGEGFIAYSLPSGWEQMQSMQGKGIIAYCLP